MPSPSAVHPAGLLQQPGGGFGVILRRGDAAAAKGKAVRVDPGSGVAVAAQQHLHKALHVNAHGDGPAHRIVLQDVLSKFIQKKNARLVAAELMV